MGIKYKLAPPVGTIIDWSNPLTRGLRGAWPMTSNKDGLGVGQDLEVLSAIGEPAYVTSEHGLVVDLTAASSQTFRHVHNERLDFQTEGITISLWARFESIPADIVLLRKAQITDKYILLIESLNSNARMYIETSVINYSTLTENNSIPLNEWIHLMGVYDGSSLQVYINNQPSGTPAAPTGALVSDTASLYIGSGSNVDRYMDGQLSNVLLWDRALNPKERQQIYEDGWQIYKSRPNFALADPLPDTRVLNVPERGITHTPSKLAMNQDGTGQQGYYTTLPDILTDRWHMFGIWVTKTSAGQFDDPLTVCQNTTGAEIWAIQTDDTTAPHDIHIWAKDVGYHNTSTNDFMNLGEWFYIYGLMYYDYAGGASPSHKTRLVVLNSSGEVVHNLSATPSGNLQIAWTQTEDELGIGDWGPTHTAFDESWTGDLFNLKWWGGDDAILRLWDQGDNIVDFVRREAFNFKPQWHTDTCIWYPLDSRWKQNSPWSHLPQLDINSGGAPEHNASGVPIMKQNQDLMVPIEYQELTLADDKEERLFMIPQRARKQQ